MIDSASSETHAGTPSWQTAQPANETATDPNAGAPAAITVTSLRKSYGANHAVNDLSFTVRTGEIFALLGPNGAGKTTTVEILEGYRSLDSGEVNVLGHDPTSESAELKHRIGVMLQSGGIYPSVKPLELLETYAAFYRDPEDPREMLRLVGLEESAETRYNRLSGGQQRRLALALALIGKPDLLFLDEPTTAMDPQARRLTWELLHNMRQRGLTILLTTHFMEEAERLADRVAIMDHGQLLALEQPHVLTQSTAQTIQFTAPRGLDCDVIGRLPSASTVREERPGFYIAETTRPIDLLAELTAWAQEHQLLITELSTGQESLEDVYLRLTGHDLRE